MTRKQPGTGGYSKSAGFITSDASSQRTYADLWVRDQQAPEPIWQDTVAIRFCVTRRLLHDGVHLNSTYFTVCCSHCCCHSERDAAAPGNVYAAPVGKHREQVHRYISNSSQPLPFSGAFAQAWLQPVGSVSDPTGMLILRVDSRECTTRSRAPEHRSARPHSLVAYFREIFVRSVMQTSSCAFADVM